MQHCLAQQAGCSEINIFSDVNITLIGHAGARHGFSNLKGMSSIASECRDIFWDDLLLTSQMLESLLKSAARVRGV